MNIVIEMQKVQAIMLGLYKEAFIHGLQAFAWTLDGVQYVGTVRTKLENAVKDCAVIGTFDDYGAVNSCLEDISVALVEDGGDSEGGLIGECESLAEFGIRLRQKIDGVLALYFTADGNDQQHVEALQSLREGVFGERNPDFDL